MASISKLRGIPPYAPDTMAANNVQTISNYKFVDARQTVAIGYAIPVICVVIVGMRFLTRILQKNYIGIDDWLSAGSLVRACNGSS